MKKGFLKTALSVMLFGSVVALTACHESAHVSGGSNPVVVAPQNTLTIAPVTIEAQGGGNNGKWYTNNGGSWRMYSGGTVEISVTSNNVTDSFMVKFP